MVGIAGRSKACLACYRRRIRCDETRPACKRCSKADMECPGYKDTTFVSFGISQTGPQRLGEKVVQAEEDTPPSQASLVRGFIMPLASDDVCISYARSCLPHTWTDLSLWRLPATDCGDPCTFMQENLAQHACLSLARALFAYRFRQHTLLAQGLSLYRTVISTLQKQLSLHRVEVYKQMIDVVIALRAFDSFIPCNPTAWISHSLGIETLFDLIGPVACNNDDLRKSLGRARPFVIMACLKSQRETIFAEERWKIIPWSDCHAQKRDVDYLMDIFADLPTALFRRTSESRSADINAIVQRLHQWASTRFEKPVEPHLDAVNSYALYLAVYATTLHAGFPSLLKLGHREQCASTSAATLRNLTATQQGTNKLMDHSNILHQYHTLLIDACHIARLYASCKGMTSSATETLVSLRQVWNLTRNMNCPLAIELEIIMRQIMGDPAARLPLFLYTK